MKYRNFAKTVAALAVVGAFGGLAQAQGTFNLIGHVSDVACTAVVNGGNDVFLPQVLAADFPNVGDVIGEKSFLISVTGCTGTGVRTATAKAYFYNATPGAVTNGRLVPGNGMNIPLGWTLELRANNNRAVPVGTNPIPVVNTDDPGVSIASGSGNIIYKVRYFRETTGYVPGTGYATTNFVVYYV